MTYYSRGPHLKVEHKYSEYSVKPCLIMLGSGSVGNNYLVDCLCDVCVYLKILSSYLAGRGYSNKRVYKPKHHAAMGYTITDSNRLRLWNRGDNLGALRPQWATASPVRISWFIQAYIEVTSFYLSFQFMILQEQASVRLMLLAHSRAVVFVFQIVHYLSQLLGPSLARG